MRERRPGVWELIVQLPRDPASGRASQLSRTVHGTKREGQRALAALVADVSAGKVLSSSMTLGELLTRWLDHVDEQLSPTTVREYRRLVTRMIDPDLGKLTLRRVTTQRLDAYYTSWREARALSDLGPPRPCRAPRCPWPSRSVGLDPGQRGRDARRRRRFGGARSTHPRSTTIERCCTRPMSTSRSSERCCGCSSPPALVVARCADCGGPTSTAPNEPCRSNGRSRRSLAVRS